MVEAGPGASWISERQLKVGHRLQGQKMQQLYFQRTTRRMSIERLTINRLLQKLNLDYNSDLTEKVERKRVIKNKDNTRLRRFRVNTK